MRRPVERTEDKKLNLRLRQRGALSKLSFLSFIRSKLGSHLSLENKLIVSITNVSIFKKYSNKTLVTNLWHFLWNRLCQSQLKHLFSCLVNPPWQHCFPSHHCVEFPQKIYGLVLHQQLTKIARPNLSSALRVLGNYQISRFVLCLSGIILLHEKFLQWLA